MTDLGELTWEDFGASAEMRGALVESVVFMHLFSPKMIEKGSAEPLPFLQLGIAIMLDKPIVLLIDETDRERVPERLRKVADRIVFYDGENLSDPETADAIQQAIKSLSPED